MDPLALWILVIDCAVLAGALAALAVTLKRRAWAWIARTWSETLDGIATDLR